MLDGNSERPSSPSVDLTMYENRWVRDKSGKWVKSLNNLFDQPSQIQSSSGF